MQAMIDISRSVAELLLENPARAAIFERNHIDYCCNGKKPLQEACARRGLDVRAIASQLAECVPADAQPRCGDWTGRSCADLVRHIVDVHHGFLRSELPRLGVLALKVSRVHGEHAPDTVEISRVFDAMRAELEDHMVKEEKMLFPSVVHMEAGQDSQFPTINAPIACMEHEHAEVGVALERLHALTGGYQPPEGACNSWRVLYHGLAELEADLHQHIHEENNVLFPRALRMEEALRGQTGRRCMC